MSWEGTEQGGAGRDRWVWLSLIPFGLGSWAPVVAGIRYRVWSWMALGLLWSAATVAGWVLSATERSGHTAPAGAVIVLAWAGGIVTSFLIRRSRRRRGLSPAVAKASGERAPRPVPTPAVWTEPRRGEYVPRPVPLPPGVTEPRRYEDPPRPPRRALWPWLSLLPLGVGSWVPIIAAVRCRVWWWALPGIAGIAATVGGFVLAAASVAPAGTVARTGANPTEAGAAFILILGAWIGGIGASFAIRPEYEVRRGLPDRRPAWPRPSARSREWSVRYALGAFVATFIAVVLLDLFAQHVVAVHLTAGMGVLLVDATLLASLVPLARRRGLSRVDLGLRPTFAGRSLWLVIQTFIAYVFLSALWTLAFIGQSTRHVAGALSQVNHLSTFNVVITVVAISLSAPIVEEIFFRGLLYRSLRNRLPIPVAALLAGLMFGFVHITGYPLITLPVKAAFGVLACLLYERTGSLLPGIALHSFVDASAIDIALTGNDYVVLIVFGSLAAIIVLRIALRKVIGTPTGAVALAEVPGESTTP